MVKEIMAQEPEETSFAYKVCLFGAGGVGKTSLARRYLTGNFEIDTKMTMGASIHVKNVKIEDKSVSLQIWDFGGEEQFRFLLPIYAKGSSGGIFMFDLTRYETFQNISTWTSVLKECIDEQNEYVPFMLVGAKKDLAFIQAVESFLGEKMVKQHDLFFKYMECSSKTGENVDEIFEIMARKMLEREGLL